MRGASLRVAGIVCALLLSAGCTGSRSAMVPGADPDVNDPLRQPHPEPELELEERIARAVAKRGEGMGSHRVRAGETIYRIAVNNGVTPEALMQANGITDPTSLSVGTVLRIPGGGGVVAAHSTGSPAPRRTGRPLSLRDRPESPTLGQLEWPLRGVLYARFGRKGTEPHDGIDLAAPLGTMVRTAGPGVVLFSGEQHSYGRIVIIEHANGLITLYAYNHELKVETGDVVKPQQEIASVGQANESSGPHLHFEVRRDGLPVDPLLYLGPVPAPAAVTEPPHPTG